jgi:PAS domain S-box-containing protein
MTRNDVLRNQLAGALLRLGELQRRADHTAGRSDVALPRAVDELERSLHELEVACETLREQAEQLEAARATADRERQRWRALFDAAPVAYLLTDGSGVIQAANTRAVALLAVTSRFLVGKPLSVFADGRRAEFLAAVKAAAASRQPVEITFSVRPRERAPVDTRATIHPTVLPDGGDGLWWVFDR